jgi:hypothetical protein
MLRCGRTTMDSTVAAAAGVRSGVFRFTLLPCFVALLVAACAVARQAVPALGQKWVAVGHSQGG